MSDFDKLEICIGYTFKNKALLKEALTHPSHLAVAGPQSRHYERLEFLGDAVLALIIANHLFKVFPEEREGYLTEAKNMLTSRHYIAELAIKLNISEHIIMSPSEIKAGGQMRASTLENCLEAIIGAIFTDNNYFVTEQIVLNWYPDIPQTLQAFQRAFNPKGKLQEWYQSQQTAQAIEYHLIEEKGPDHEKKFIVEVSVNGKVVERGEGGSKKEAEEDAARKALWLLQKDDETGNT